MGQKNKKRLVCCSKNNYFCIMILDKFDSIEMSIDIVQNGAIATGNVYPQPQRTDVLWDAYLIKSIGYSDTRESLIYVSAAIEKCIKKKFSYECKATWNRVRHESI